MDNINIIYTLISFLLVGIVFMIVLGITFKVLLKKYSLDNSKLKFYGLFLGMNNKQILSFSIITLNFVYLLFLLLTFSKLNFVYVIFSFILIILGDILIKNYPKGIINILYNAISIFSIFICNLLYEFLQEQESVVMLVCLILVIALSFLFSSYILFKTLNNVIVKDKYIKEDKYSL